MPQVPDWLRIWYRKPQWRDIRDYTRQLNDEDIRPTRSSSPNQTSGQSSSIPNRLALDRVLENKTCSPMSLHDFYMYLQHIEHSAENLEFYLWYKNYEAHAQRSASRGNAAEMDGEEVLPPPPGYTDPRSWGEIPGVSGAPATIEAKRSFSSISESIMKAEPPCARLARPETKWTDRFFWWSPSTTTGSTMEQQLISRPAPCARGTCPVDPNDVEKGPAVLPLQLSTQLSKAAPQAGNRAELDAAIARFLQPGAEKELNISHPLRQRTLAKLQVSSDPQHLKPVADHIYEVMKNCSHRNFVALGVATGSYETICVGNLIGIACVLGGFLLVLLRALYPHIGAHSRWEVFDSWPLWWLGTTVPLLGTQGMCSIMLSLSKRQTLPWEKFEEDNSASAQAQRAKLTGTTRWWRRYRAFMDRTIVYDRKMVKVEDKNLRTLQRLIMFQCSVGGAVAACLAVLLFIFLPVWKETAR
ncbi:hypothetical protein VSDG_09236 [Cytospora chrysosperma]|uniref:RGS domain-containing protein n=1 Tax=Cytospora chrysosperma TaxID=252740 RepID=A0A423VBT0_CYTCH|nr:hypothetical protein VSDG_09236 [Valsa sordida]